MMNDEWRQFFEQTEMRAGRCEVLALEAKTPEAANWWRSAAIQWRTCASAIATEAQKDHGAAALRFERLAVAAEKSDDPKQEDTL